MIATYTSNNQFTVDGDHTSEFIEGRRVKADCGLDGYKYSTIQTSSYSSPNTTVTIDENILTSNLIAVLYGIISMGDEGSLPYHRHDDTEGHGGVLSFNSLEETPSTLSGTTGQYAQSTGSGIVWSTTPGAETFTDLNDTPVTYSGTSGKYAQSTGSGIVWSTVSEVETFIDLTDTPSTYSGTEGQYAQSTGSGIVWTTVSDITDHSELDNLDYASSGHTGFQPAGDYYTESEVDDLLTTYSGTLQDNIDSKSDTSHLHDDRYYTESEVDYLLTTVSGSGSTTSGIQTFTDLTDTPATYSSGKYFRTTASGIGAIDGIILKAANESEWMIKVTNSGILYTEAM